MTRNVEHTCDIDDKYCQEGADPNRHPDHNTHIGGCICSLGDTYNKILAHAECVVEIDAFYYNSSVVNDISAIQIANYGNGTNLTIECIICNEVIIDIDKPIEVLNVKA